MNDLIKRLREAFDADRVAEKNLAIRAASDRLTALKAAGDGLAGVAGGHSDECGKWWEAAENCTCGLTAALKQWKEASDGL